MRKELEKRMPSVVITPANLPSLAYLQIVWSQSREGHWEVTPWKQILSEEASVQLRGRKALQPRGDLLDIVAAAAGVQQEVWGQEISGAAFRIQSILRVRAHAFCMVKKSHMAS